MERTNMKSIRLILIGMLIGAIIGGAVTYSQGPGRRYINLPSKNPQLPFSDGVLVGNTLYLAGRLGTDPKTNTIPADIEQEIRLMLDGFKSTLAQAGMTMDNIVTVTIYCPDLTLYDKFNGVYRTYFGKDFPARAFIGSGPLLRGAHFEMQAIAAK
jgi:2-iminobutanoate/2-iminopropanoate deaminase